MTNALIVAANTLFGWAVITAVLSWILAAMYPPFSRTFSKTIAPQASNFTLMYGLLAPIAALVALALLSLPVLSFAFISEHCHNQSCAPHTLHMTTDTLEGLISVAVVVTLLTGLCAGMIVQIRRGQRRLKVLSQLSELRAAKYRLVESPERIAWCAGLLKPQVYLSSGLINSLTPPQVQIILAHEQMHALRRDNLRKWLIHWATLIWPTPYKKAIRQALSNYCEHSCDLAAIQLNQGQSDLNGFVDTLASCYSNANNDARSQQTRIKTLKRELAAQTFNAEYGDATYIKPALATAGLWLLSIIMSVHFGHPLLEWLSQ